MLPTSLTNAPTCKFLYLPLPSYFFFFFLILGFLLAKLQKKERSTLFENFRILFDRAIWKERRRVSKIGSSHSFDLPFGNSSVRLLSFRTPKGEVRLNLTLNFTRKWDWELKRKVSSSKARRERINFGWTVFVILGIWSDEYCATQYIHRHPPSYLHALIHSMFDKR